MSILSKLNEINNANDTNILAALNRFTGEEADDIEEAVGNLGGVGGSSTVEVTIEFPELLADTSYIDVAVQGTGGAGTIRFNQHIDEAEGPVPVYIANVPTGAMINVYQIETSYLPTSISAYLEGTAYAFPIPIHGSSARYFAIPAADSVTINMQGEDSGEAH